MQKPYYLPKKKNNYCLLRSPAILKYVIGNTVGMQNGLTFTGSECLMACILKLLNSIGDNSIEHNTETILASDAKQTATGSTLTNYTPMTPFGISTVNSHWRQLAS